MGAPAAPRVLSECSLLGQATYITPAQVVEYEAPAILSALCKCPLLLLRRTAQYRSIFHAFWIHGRRPANARTMRNPECYTLCARHGCSQWQARIGSDGRNPQVQATSPLPRRSEHNVSHERRFHRGWKV